MELQSKPFNTIVHSLHAAPTLHLKHFKRSPEVCWKGWCQQVTTGDSMLRQHAKEPIRPLSKFLVRRQTAAFCICMLPKSRHNCEIGLFRTLSTVAGA